MDTKNLKKELCRRLTKAVDDELDRFNAEHKTEFVSVTDSNYDTDFGIYDENDEDWEPIFSYGY